MLKLCYVACALVLFNLYTAAINGDKTVLLPANIAVYFIKVIFISPLIGFALGIPALLAAASVNAVLGVFAVGALRLSNRRKKEEDTIIQIGTTIGICHLSFFIGETILGVSGVVACVVTG